MAFHLQKMGFILLNPIYGFMKIKKNINLDN